MSPSFLRYREFFLNIQTLYKKKASLRAFVELILSITTVTIFLNFALKPTVLTIISLYNDIQGKQKTIATLNQKINDLDTASSLLNQYQDTLAAIDASVGDTPKPDLFTQQIQGLAAKDSVTILGVSVGQVVLVGTPPAQKKLSQVQPLPNDARSMDVSISVKGDYPNLITFLKDFEKLRTIAKTDNTGIVATKSENALSIVTVISGRVPYTGNPASTKVASQ